MNARMAALLKSAENFLATFADVPVFGVQITTADVRYPLRLQTEPAHLRSFSPMYGSVREESINGGGVYLSIQVGNVALVAVEGAS